MCTGNKWVAIDRARNQMVDFEVGDRNRGESLRLALRLQESYKIEGSL